jgi:hypothetical protein
MADKELVKLNFWDILFVTLLLVFAIGGPAYLLYDWWSSREPAVSSGNWPVYRQDPNEPSQLDRIEKGIKELQRKELYP